MSSWLSKSKRALRDVQERLFGPSPYDVSGQWSLANDMERKGLLRLLMSAMEITGMPEEWDADYFWLHLLLDGYITVTDTAVGIIPLQCGYSGINVWNRPTKVIVGNPVLGEFERTIGYDCALIHLDYSYVGLSDILDYYSYMLASCDSAVAVNLMNTKVTFIAEVESEAQRKTMNKMYENMSFGEPAVFVRKNSMGNYFFTNPKQSYIAADVQMLKQDIKNEFKSLFGIYSSVQKRERVGTEELERNNDDVRYNIQQFIDNINAGLTVVRELYGIDMTCRKRVYDDGNIDQPDTVGRENME